MTQAHKTPGALVQFKPLDPNDKNDQMYFAQYEGRVFEIIEERHPGHMVIKDYKTGKIVADERGQPWVFHDDRFQTIPKALRHKLGR